MDPPTFLLKYEFSINFFVFIVEKKNCWNFVPKAESRTYLCKKKKNS